MPQKTRLTDPDHQTPTSYSKNLEAIRARLPEASAQEMTNVISTLTEKERNMLEMFIKTLSDRQFRRTIIRMQKLTSEHLAFGVKLLAGAYADPIAYGMLPKLPKVSRKQKKIVDQGPEETSAEWPMLQQLVHALPTELFDMIKGITLEAAFLADIFPCQKAGEIVHELHIGEDINVQALGLIDRSTHSKYNHRVWTENLWVLSTGASAFSPSPISCLPPTIRRKISRVYLEFSCEHFDCARAFVRESQPFRWELSMGLVEWHYLPIVVGAMARTLLHIWETVAADIVGLVLDELTLDFNGALAPDGSFLGLRLARMLPVFPWGQLPGVLNIQAPSLKTAETIRGMITEKNKRFEARLNL